MMRILVDRQEQSHATKFVSIKTSVDVKQKYLLFMSCDIERMYVDHD
jgi:hypothetical protein